MGLLHCMQTQLTSAEYWRQSYHSSASQTLLTWLGIIIPCQPLLHAKVQCNEFIRAVHSKGPCLHVTP